MNGSTDPQGAPPRKRSFGPLMIAGLLAAGVGGSVLFAQVRRSRAVAPRSGELAQRLDDLGQRYGELTTKHEQLTADRDNLFTQISRALQERDKAEANRQMMEEVFMKAEAERLDLLTRLEPLEQQLVELQRSQEALVQERQNLERQLQRAESRSHEKELRAQLDDMRRKEKEMRRATTETKRELRAKARREEQTAEQLMRLGKRLQTLQQEYSEEVSNNASLRRQVTQLPVPVTGMAREHQRLLRELADTHYNMGILFTKRKEFGQALKEFQKVIELRPDDPEAHYNVGVIYAEHIPDRERAMAFFRKYLAINPRGRNANWAKKYVATWQAWEVKERLE